MAEELNLLDLLVLRYLKSDIEEEEILLPEISEQ